MVTAHRNGRRRRTIRKPRPNADPDATSAGQGLDRSYEHARPKYSTVLPEARSEIDDASPMAVVIGQIRRENRSVAQIALFCSNQILDLGVKEPAAALV